MALNKNSSKILKELISKDKKLINVIDFDKKCPLFGNPIISENNLFLEISQTIVGQQISFLAADAVWKRLLNSVNKKKDFLNLFENKNLKWARQQGLSERKYEYIRDLSLKIKKKDIESFSLKKLEIFFQSIGEEVFRAKQVYKWLWQKGVPSFEKMTIKESLQIISDCDLYIGNDTGWAHISVALKIKALTIFCDSPVAAYGSYSSKMITVEPEGVLKGATTHDTLGKDKISFDEVYNKSIQMLN